MAEDEDIEPDSEAYSKWRKGNNKDKYASSRTPTETSSKSGSYTIPKDEDDEYALPGEDSGSNESWLDADLNWPMIITAFVIFAIVASAIVAFAFSSDASTKPSKWPETEGIIVEQGDSRTFIDDNGGEDWCEDQNDDGWLDDLECWNVFVFTIDLTTQYSVDNETYQIAEPFGIWERYWVDELKQNGGENGEQLFENFTNYWNEEATNGSISLNSTVSVIYNLEYPNDAYAFNPPPEGQMGFLGYFFMCCVGFLCLPIAIVGVVIGWARNADTGGYRGNRRWSFGGRHHSRGGSTRRHTPTRRSGGGRRR